MSQLSLLNSTTLKTFKYGPMDRSRFMFRKHRLARPKANWLPALDEITIADQKVGADGNGRHHEPSAAGIRFHQNACVFVHA
jgi:hypothetical protein